MNLLTKERTAVAGVFVLLVGIIILGALWFNTNYVLMPVQREKVENVKVCIDNIVSCDLIYESKEDIPE